MVNSISLQSTSRTTPIYVGGQIQDEEPVSVMAFGPGDSNLGVFEDNTKVHFFRGYTETKNARIIDQNFLDYNYSSLNMHFRGASSVTVAFDLTAEDMQKDLGLYLSHLSSDIHDGTYASAARILVNGEVFSGKYVPKSHDWIANDHITNNFMKLSDLLHQGTNTIEIQLHESARSNYWLHSIMIK